MKSSPYRSLLFASAAAIGLCGLARSAAASVSALPKPGDFQVIESCNPSDFCSGNFDVVNNSQGDGNWYVYQFVVGNQTAFRDATTQNNWSACIASTPQTGSCTGNGGFDYYNNNGASDSLGDLANDVGPGQSSSLFTFTTLVPASPATLLVVNANGGTATVNITATDRIPEPASLTVLGTALVGLFGTWRRRRSRAAA